MRIGMRICILFVLLLCGVYHMNAYADDYLTISAVGDIMMGTTYPENVLPPHDGTGIFDNVKGEFKGSDIVFGNLEGALIDEGKTTKCDESTSGNCYAFKTPTRYVKYLRDAGFNVMSIANNHSSDFGFEGIESTINTLSSVDIMATGGETVAHLTIKGKRVAIVGFSSSSSPYSYSLLNVSEAMKIIKMLKEANDIVVVSFHGGAEGKSATHISDRDEVFLEENRGNVIKFSRSVIDAGADMVVGHGPHVLRALEVYKGKLIAYSLGNFLTYGMFNIKGPNGLSVILKASINTETGDFVQGDLIPIKLLNGGIPEIDLDKEAVRLVNNLTKEDIGNSNITIAHSGALLKMEKDQGNSFSLRTP